MIKGVIFDMDGVIIDSEILYQELTDQFLRQQGYQLGQKELEQLIGLGIKESEDLIYSWMADRYEEKKDLVADFYAYLEQAPIDYKKIMLADARWLIEKLQEEGYQLAIASAAQRQVVDQVVQANQLGQAFPLTLAGDEVQRSKPDPEIYLTTMEKMGLEASQVLIIEDSPPGLAAARQSGARVVARKSPYFDYDLEADYIVDDLRLVHGILTKLSPQDPFQVVHYGSKGHLKSLFFRKNLAGLDQLPEGDGEDDLIINYEGDQEVLLTLVGQAKGDLLDIRDLAYGPGLAQELLEDFLDRLLAWMGENQLEHLGLQDDRVLDLLGKMIRKRRGGQDAN